MNGRYTKKELEFLKTAYLSMNVRALTEAFNKKFGTNKTKKAIKSALKNHDFKCGRNHKDRLVENRPRIFTKEQADFISKNYYGRSAAEMTALFNETFNADKSVQQIKTFVHNRGIVSGRTGHFEKGHKPQHPAYRR